MEAWLADRHCAELEIEDDVSKRLLDGGRPAERRYHKANPKEVEVGCDQVDWGGPASAARTCG